MSQTAIMNMALDLLEEEAILSAEDDRAPVRWLNRNFGPVRDSLLRMHPWNFALKRAALAASTTAPAFGWTRSFPLPTDCLRLLPLFDEGGFESNPIQHEIEGRAILTNAGAPLRIRYVSRVEDTNLFDAMFTQALAATLAARMASFLTGKQSYAERMQQLSQDTILQAQMADALEGSAPEAVGDAWENARVTGVVL